MASQAVRAPIVVEESGFRQDTSRAPKFADEPGESGRRMKLTTRATTTLVALCALLALFVFASDLHVAQASTTSLPTGGSDATACEGGASAPHESAQYRQDSDLPPVGELTALESEDPEDPEHDARLDGPAARLTVSLAQLPSAGNIAPGATGAWTAQLLVSSALPRGPPHAPG